MSFKRAMMLSLCGAVLFGAQLARARDVVLGQVVPLSGSNALNGQALSAGAKLYIDYVNAHGGVAGNHLKLLVRDDGYKVPETLRLTRELIDKDEAVALLAVLGTANNEALVQEKVLSNAGIALVGPRTGASSLYGVPGVFTIRPKYEDEARKIAAQMATMGMQSVAAVYQDDSFGSETVKALDAAMQASGHPLAAQVSFPRNTVKVEQAVDQMLKLNPSAIVFISVTNPLVAFLKQYRERGGMAQIACVSTVDAGTVVKEAGLKNAHGLWLSVVMPNPNRETIAVIREMTRVRDELQAQDVAITFNSVEGYITAKVVVEGLRRAGPNPTRASVKQALAGIRNFDAGGYLVDLTNADTSKRFVDVGVISGDGQVLQ